MATDGETLTPRKRRRTTVNYAELARGNGGETSRSRDHPNSSPALKPRNDSTTSTNTALKRKRPTPSKTNGDAYGFESPLDRAGEIPDSEDERRNSERVEKKSGKTPTPRREGRNVYDFPDSGDELSVGPLDTEDTANKAEKRQGALNGTPSRKESGKGRRSSQRKTEGSTAANGPNGVRSSPSTPSKRLSNRRPATARAKETIPVAIHTANGDGDEPGLSMRSNVAQDNSWEDDGPRENTPKLKGILTPRRRGGGQRRKSVAFENGRTEPGAEVYFEDLPSKATSKAPKPPAQPARKSIALETTKDGDGGAGDNDDDDELCTICHKPDSTPPNEIIFCDGCDLAFHQDCYRIPSVPEGDWFCQECSQAGSSGHPGSTPHKKVPLVRKMDERPDILNFELHLCCLQRVLLDRCTGRRRIKLRDQDEAHDKTLQLIEQTIVAGEGNSMLVIGARGSGKTTLVESALSQMTSEHKDEFHIVRLNGFIHTDDKLAMKEIWRQLGKEMSVEDDLINRTSNYADTFASLLALLSHPSEIAGAQQGVTSRSVIFVIDEFDLFATHVRQTLLYNLFDIAQAKKAPIAVLGLTTRIDVVESLEKRVKSRFSHRYVYLSLPKSLPAFWSICRQGLVLDEGDVEEEGMDKNIFGSRQFLEWWAKKVEELYKEPKFRDRLEYHFCATKSVSAFLASCILPLSSVSPESLSLKAHFCDESALSIGEPDSKLHLLESLSDLDLSLLIAAARLDIVAHTDTVNFAMAYDEYTSLMGKQRVQTATSGLLAVGGGARVWGRGVASLSWERLVTLGLLVPAGPAGRGGGGSSSLGGLEAKMWKVDVALEEIPAAVKLNAVLARWCREI